MSHYIRDNKGNLSHKEGSLSHMNLVMAYGTGFAAILKRSKKENIKTLLKIAMYNVDNFTPVQQYNADVIPLLRLFAR